MREQVPQHFCNQNRDECGEGHFKPVYDPIKHGVTLEYRPPEFWERERIKAAEANQDAGSLLLSFLCVSAWVASPPWILMQPSSPWGLAAIYYGASVVVAFLRFTVALPFEKNGRMSAREELLHAPERVIVASLLWPVFLLFYQSIFSPIGLVQQLKLEAAWRRKYNIWRPLTDEERHHIEKMWRSGYEEALAKLTSDIFYGRNAPLVCFLLVSIFWTTVGCISVPTEANEYCLSEVEIKNTHDCRAGPEDECNTLQFALPVSVLEIDWPRVQRPPLEWCDLMSSAQPRAIDHVPKFGCCLVQS